MVERFNKTLRDIMWKTFTIEEHNEWVDRLPEIVDQYNNKVHSAIKMTPLEASELSKHKEKRLMNDQYSNSLGPIGKPKFELADWVRVLRTKDKFEKGYTARWSKEIFQSVRIDVNKPITYYLKDENGDMEKGIFYENELQKTKQKPEVPAPLTNEIKIDDWRYIETKSKKKFADIEVHVMVNNK